MESRALHKADGLPDAKGLAPAAGGGGSVANPAAAGTTAGYCTAATSPSAAYCFLLAVKVPLGCTNDADFTALLASRSNCM